MSQIIHQNHFIHHFGHSLTYSFLCRIPQIISQCMEDYYIITSRKIPEGLDKGKKSEKSNPASMCKSRPVGTDSNMASV
jgi:hypothetical protein